MPELARPAPGLERVASGGATMVISGNVRGQRPRAPTSNARAMLCIRGLASFHRFQLRSWESGARVGAELKWVVGVVRSRAPRVVCLVRPAKARGVEQNPEGHTLQRREFDDRGLLPLDHPRDAGGPAILLAPCFRSRSTRGWSKLGIGIGGWGLGGSLRIPVPASPIFRPAGIDFSVSTPGITA